MHSNNHTLCHAPQKCNVTLSWLRVAWRSDIGLSRLRHLKRFALGIQSCKRADNQIFRDYIESPPPSEPIYLQFQVRLYYYSDFWPATLGYWEKFITWSFFSFSFSCRLFIIKTCTPREPLDKLSIFVYAHGSFAVKNRQNLLKLIAIFPKILKSNRIFRVRVNKSCS